MNTYADIITLDELKEYARPTSIHLDASHAATYIQESEGRFIIPAIGYELYNILCHPDGWGVDAEVLGVVAKGGEYTGTACGCDGSSVAWCHGLKKATIYFAYALMIKADGGVMSRAGLMRHRDEYSDHADDKKEQNNNVMDAAELYLESCLQAIKALGLGARKARQTRATIKAIGD